MISEVLRTRYPTRQRRSTAAMRGHSRPLRDRAIVFVLLGTGLRRAELVNLDLAQVEPADPEKLRQARAARLVGVRGNGRTTRTFFLGQDARTALADYLTGERLHPVGRTTCARGDRLQGMRHVLRNTGLLLSTLTLAATAASIATAGAAASQNPPRGCASTEAYGSGKSAWAKATVCFTEEEKWHVYGPTTTELSVPRVVR